MKNIYIVTVAVALAIGFGVIWFFPNSVGALFDRGKELVMPLYTAWMRIPTALRNFIQVAITAITGSLSVFFAWTKSLAIKKMNETKQQASQRISQIQTEQTGIQKGVQQSTGAILDRVGTLQEKVTELTDTNTLLKEEKKILADKLLRARSDRDELSSKLEAIELATKLDAKRVA